MRMTEFHIEGFGCLRDLSMTDVSPELSIVLGDNEAGKTTLLAFFRSVLFGLPSRKQANFYPPLNGGRKGGRIVLLNDQSERIIVERFEGPRSGLLDVTLPDGSACGEEQLRQRLGMTTADVYKNVFAFGLSELQTFESLKTEQVRDAIYSAGIGRGRRPLAEVIKALDKGCGELFAPRASRPVMNQALKRIDDLRQEIDAHATDQDEYHRIQSDLRDTENTINGIGSELRERRQRLERLMILQQAWDDWVTLNERRKELNSLPRDPSFPDDGVQRLETLLTEQRTVRDQLKEASEENRNNTKYLSSIEVDEECLSHADEIRELERGLERHEQNRQQHVSIQTERELAEEILDQLLTDLGQEWSEDKLREFDLGIPVKEKIDITRVACEDASQALRERKLSLDQHLEQLKEAVRDEDGKREETERIPEPFDRINVEDIKSLQRGLARYEGARDDLPGVEQQCEADMERLHIMLRELGPDWTEERLIAFDNSVAVQEKVSAHRDDLSTLRSQREQATDRTAETEQRFNDAKAALNRDNELLQAMPSCEGVDETSLVERKRHLRSLRSLLNDNAQCRADQAHKQERKQDLETQMASLKRRSNSESLGLPRWVAPMILAFGLFGLFGLGIGRGDWISGTVMFVLSLILVATLFVARHRSVTGTSLKKMHWVDEAKDVARRIADVNLDIEKTLQEQSTLDSQIHEQAELVRIDGVPDVPKVDEQESRVERQLDALQTRRPIEQRRDHDRERLAQVEERMEHARNALAELTNLVSQAEAAWRMWLAEARMPEALSPDVATNVLARLASARELLRAIESKRVRIHEMTGERDQYECQIQCVATSSGFEDTVPTDTDAAVEFLFGRLEEHKRRRLTLERASQRLDEAKQQTAQIQANVAKAEGLHQHAESEDQRCRGQWIELLKRRGFRDSLAVQSAQQVVQAIQRAKEQLNQVNRYRKQEQSFSHQIDSFHDRVRIVAEGAGNALSPDEDMTTYVANLVSKLRQTEERDQSARNLQEKIQASKNRVDRLQSQISDRQQEIDKLFSAAAATDEEEFRRCASDFETFHNIKDQIQVLELRLRQLTGGGEALTALKKELTDSTPEKLTEEQREVEESIEPMEQDRNEAVDNRGRLREQLMQLESSEELSRLRNDMEAARAEFQEHAEQWAILKLASHLIDRARQKYERERRPAVLKQAEKHFACFTKGNYTEIRAPMDTNQVIVIAQNGTTKEIDQLSRGTAEQLYLSLRFGFVQEFVTHSEPLPLIFDDIMVNFDPDRAAAAAAAIIQLSKSLQILLFTCHPSTVRLMREIDDRIPTYVLESGRLTETPLADAQM